VLDPAWPIERRRELVKSAVELYRWRGTKRGLIEYLRIYTGSVAEISEYIPGMILDSNTQLGVNTRLGSSGTGHHFIVTIGFNANGNADPVVVKAIIESQKPAHTTYTLQIKPQN
jgi:P2-related tail formation protein